MCFFLWYRCGSCGIEPADKGPTIFGWFVVFAVSKCSFSVVHKYWCSFSVLETVAVCGYEPIFDTVLVFILYL